MNSIFLRSVMATIVVLTAAMFVVAVILLPYAAWAVYGLSFQFVAAVAVFIFVLLVAITSW